MGPWKEQDAVQGMEEGALHPAPGVRIAGGAMRFQFSRSGGPGGQNVNKVNTRAELWVAVGRIEGLSDRAAARLRKLAGRRLTQADEIHITAETGRSQRANRTEAMDRLSELILAALPEPKKRRPTRPSAAARRRRLEQKKRRSEIKQLRRLGQP